MGFDVHTFLLLFTWISCSWTFSKTPVIGGFPCFTDIPLLLRSWGFHAHDDWSSNVPASMPSPTFPCTLSFLCPHCPHPAPFWSHCPLCGALSWEEAWLVIFKSSQRLHQCQPFRHDQVTLHSAAVIAAAPLSASVAGVNLSCHHAVQGTPVGTLGALSTQAGVLLPTALSTQTQHP